MGGLRSTFDIDLGPDFGGRFEGGISFAAIDSIESKVGPVGELFFKARSGTITFRAIALILWESIRVKEPKPDPLTFDALCDALIDMGLADSINRVIPILDGICNSGPDEQDAPEGKGGGAESRETGDSRSAPTSAPRLDS